MSSHIAGEGAGRRLLLVLVTALAVMAGGLTAPTTARAAVGVPVTYLGHAYASTVLKPSENKPQSKLWHHDGAWWSLMVVAGGTAVHIHELMPDHTWRNTGAQVDARLNSTGDALWSERDDRLYVASRTTGTNLQVNAFTYVPAVRSWLVVPGYPVTVNSGGGSESATIAQDSLGRLWVTYTRLSRVWVAHSDVVGGLPGTTWTAGFHPAVPDVATSSDDISAVIAFGSSIGVMWSDQSSGAFRFAVHDDAAGDGTWRVEDIPMLADDHINLKQLAGDPQGRIFAAIKTSADEAAAPLPTDTLVGVLTRTPGAGGVGSWSLTPAGTVADKHTRPILMIDATAQELYFFATSPGPSGGDIYYKKSPLSQLAFPAGLGQKYADATPVLNDASGAKESVTSATGMVVLAVAEGRKSYAHAETELGGTTTDPAPTATTSPVAGATGVPVDANVTATFTEPVQGVSTTTFQLRDAAGAVVPASVTQGTGNLWVLDPAAPLAAGTAYTATLTGGATGIRDAANISLAPNPLTWSFTTSAATPDPAPTATTSPAAEATGVARTTNVTATFSEPVQGVDGTTFTLRPATGGTPLAAVVSYSATTRVATLNPSADLAAGTRYTATLTGGATAIRDTGNTPLATTTWSFTTASASGDTVAPTLRSRNPAVDATRVTVGANVTATFSENVQGVDPTTFSLRNAVTGAPVAGAVTRSGTTNTWILNPDVNLAPDTRYTATLTGGATGIRDLAGNPLTAAPITWTFLTGPQPKVSARTPASGATGVSRTANVTVTFTEAVQNVTATTFKLTNAATGAAVTGVVSRNGSTNQYVLDPGVTLAANTVYQVTATGGTGGISDLAGNPLATVTWRFTTGSA